jgi:hypothetical protein
MTHKLFSNYDGELPELAGFVDDSWQNDVCPSLLNIERNLKLWVDYVDPDRRECGGARYTLCAYDESEDQYLYLFSSDSLSTIEEFLK